MRALRLLGPILACATALLAAGCNPQLKGLCTTNAQCSSEESCVSGICIERTASSDGGTSGAQCNPACGSGEACDNGACVSAGESFVNITSPESGASFGATTATILIQAHSPEAISNVTVSLNTPHGSVLQATAASTTLDGYTATLDLAMAAVTDGDYQLLATMTYGSGQKLTSVAVAIVVDKTGPVVTPLPVTYPNRPSGSPATGAFLRDEQVVVKANISDPLAGLSAQSPPAVTAPGMAAVKGVAGGGDTYTFTFSARTPTFNAMQGPITLTITATDQVGNTGTATMTVELTRLRWIWTKPGSGPVSTAPAIAGTILVLGGADTMYGVRRADGSTSWQQSTTYPTIGDISVGPSGDAYVVTSQGYVAAVNPADGVSGSRVVYSCPSGAGPTVHTLVAGGAIGTTPLSSTDSTPQETLFVFSQDGYLVLFRQQSFPSLAGLTGSCAVQSQVSTGTNTAGVPALQPETGSTNVFVGDDNGNVTDVSVSLSSSVTSTFTFTKTWTYAAGSAIRGPVAIGDPNGAAGLLFGDAQGLARALNLNKSSLWTFGPLETAVSLRASPVMDGSDLYLLDDGGVAQKVKLQGGGAAWETPLALPARTTGADSAPVLAQDGTAYLPSGTQVAVVSASGNTEWTFDATTTPTWATGQSVDLVTPILSCSGDLYVVTTSSTAGYVDDVITDSTTGPSQAGWPRSFHDNHNTSNASTALSSGGTCTD